MQREKTTGKFTTNRDEPLIDKIALCVSHSMASKLRGLENYQEFVRQAIAEKLERDSS